MLVDELPKQLRIENREILEFAAVSPELRHKFDAVIGNPPFVKWDLLSSPMRERVETTLGESTVGKADLYLAVLKVAMDFVRPGGFLLFVLPHSFLISDSAAQMRKEISKTFWIRVVADLSQVNVFEKFGVYVILLVIQRKVEGETTRPGANIIRCRDFVGHALQDVLEQKQTTADFYQVFNTGQESFSERDWILLPPIQTELLAKMKRFTLLQDPVGDSNWGRYRR